MNVATNTLAGRPVELLGCADLLDRAVLDHCHALSERHRLDLVVGHVDSRDAQPFVQVGELGAHRDAQLRVEVRERLVHEVGRGLADDGAPHGDALALAARQLTWLTVEILGEPEHGRCGLHSLSQLRLGGTADLQCETEVVAHRHVRVERVVLEDHRHVAVAGGCPGHVAVADQDPALCCLLEPGDHPKQRRLPAARRPDEHHELAGQHGQVDVADRSGAVRVHLGDALEDDRSHGHLMPLGERFTHVMPDSAPFGETLASTWWRFLTETSRNEQYHGCGEPNEPAREPADGDPADAGGRRRRHDRSARHPARRQRGDRPPRPRCAAAVRCRPADAWRCRGHPGARAALSGPRVTARSGEACDRESGRVAHRVGRHGLPGRRVHDTASGRPARRCRHHRCHELAAGRH